jgi:monovalent cation:H+ antiporter-2, CPA2 family
MTFGTLETILCALSAALVISVIFRRFQLPVVLGYFLVGVLMGPYALGLIPDHESIKDLAEFGIVFLMFTVGLEFSQAKLFALKKAVFLVGGLQVLFSIVATTIVGMFLHMTMLSALVVGGIVAMSSTAIVIKQLNDQMELHTSHGLNAVGILLFQDLAVIPFIILIVGLANPASSPLWAIFLWAFVKGIFAIFLISLAGRWLLKPAFLLIAKTRAVELFTLSVLLITLLAAWLTDVLGLSYAFGAFLGGIMLSETEFRHQIEIEIRPFRDILLGLFFISIGMLADLSQWYAIWKWIALLLAALTLGKMLLIVLICRITGTGNSAAVRTGLVLAQGGEFGFAILTLALAHSMLPVEYSQVILAALLISIAISPIFIYFNKAIADYLLPKATLPSNHNIEEKIVGKAKDLEKHVIICGFGRVGQYIAYILNKAEYPYIGLDINADIIKKATHSGENVLFGDASHPGILHAAGIERAKALVISFDKIKPAIRVLSMARREHKDLPIIVRCKDQRELEELKKYGATEIVAEIFEESLTLSQHLLQCIEMPTQKISDLLEEVRSKDYGLLRRIFSGSFDPEEGESLLYAKLIPVLLSEGSYAIGRNIRDLPFKEIGVEVIAVRRGKTRSIKPHPSLKLHMNDIVILYGSIANLADAESMLLVGE